MSESDRPIPWSHPELQRLALEHPEVVEEAEIEAASHEPDIVVQADKDEPV